MATRQVRLRIWRSLTWRGRLGRRNSTRAPSTLGMRCRHSRTRLRCRRDPRLQLSRSRPMRGRIRVSRSRDSSTIRLRASSGRCSNSKSPLSSLRECDRPLRRAGWLDDLSLRPRTLRVSNVVIVNPSFTVCSTCIYPNTPNAGILTSSPQICTFQSVSALGRKAFRVAYRSLIAQLRLTPTEI